MIPESEGKTRLISIRLDDALLEYVKSEANFQGVSIGEFFREKVRGSGGLQKTLARIEAKIDCLLEKKNKNAK
jgi:hypothetical protein